MIYFVRKVNPKTLDCWHQYAAAGVVACCVFMLYNMYLVHTNMYQRGYIRKQDGLSHESSQHTEFSVLVPVCVLPSTPSVEWPRYVERGRWVRCWLGGQLLFF